jgi:hypothetical protein
MPVAIVQTPEKVSSWVMLMEGASKQPVPRRRSQRIVMRVPLLINSADSAAATEWEPVETIVISLYGGLIRTRQEFGVGTTLDIRMRNRSRWARARVVRVAPAANGGGFELGFEILDQPGFWEMNFLPDRWSGKVPLPAGKR